MGEGKHGAMIDRVEIPAVATDSGLSAEIVEKDFILGWRLAGICAQPAAPTAGPTPVAPPSDTRRKSNPHKQKKKSPCLTFRATVAPVE